VKLNIEKDTVMINFDGKFVKPEYFKVNWLEESQQYEIILYKYYIVSYWGNFLFINRKECYFKKELSYSELNCSNLSDKLKEKLNEEKC